MGFSRAFTAALLLAAALVVPAAAQTQAGPAGAMQSVEIVDPNGFDRPMRAATITIPAGWQYQGQVRWNIRAPCQAETTQFVFAAQDRSGRFGVEIIPGTAWQATNLPVPQVGGGCAFLAIRTPQEYLQVLVPKVRPGARILDFRDRPDLITVRVPDFPGVAGIQTEHSLAGGEVLISYAANGGEERETIAAITDVTVTRMPGVVPGEVREFLTGSALPAFAARAPAGQLDFAAAEAIRLSFTLDPDWQGRMLNQQSANAAIAAKGVKDRAAITAETGRYTGDLITKGWQERQAAQDLTQEKVIRTIRGETQYQTPDGGTVNLPSQYDRAWQMQGGGFAAGNGGFDPNRDLGVNATELTPNE